jgi:hypothetical protein
VAPGGGGGSDLPARSFDRRAMAIREAAVAVAMVHECVVATYVSARHPCPPRTPPPSGPGPNPCPSQPSRLPLPPLPVSSGSTPCTPLPLPALSQYLSQPQPPLPRLRCTPSPDPRAQIARPTTPTALNRPQPQHYDVKQVLTEGSSAASTYASTSGTNPLHIVGAGGAGGPDGGEGAEDWKLFLVDRAWGRWGAAGRLACERAGWSGPRLTPTRMTHPHPLAPRCSRSRSCAT